MRDREFLKGLPPDQKELGARFLDKAEVAMKRFQPAYTDFLDPGQQIFCERLAKPIYGLGYKFLGGFEQAERKRMALFPDDGIAADVMEGICCLEVIGNFRFAKVSHRDFLGGILGTGVKREKLGDILVTETGCQLVAAREIKDYLIQNLVQVHQVTVQVEEITPEQLQEIPLQVKEINSTVSSLRLDSVAGCGCGLSRSQIAKYIAAEKVKVNWEVKTSPGHQVVEGDIISVRGFGRMKLAQVKGETKKGRISITIVRYL